MNSLTKMFKRIFMKEVYMDELYRAHVECELMSNYYADQIKIINMYLDQCEASRLIGAARDLIFEKQTIERLKTEYDLNIVEIKKERAKTK